MSQPIISVRGVGKEYRIGELSHANTLRDALSGWFDRSAKPRAKGPGRERIWALKDVCFDVAEGEVVGIIGANGAGKSTLLKILSRITEPTTGEIELRGRVASLLEVGTGFNDELTGRENIILNGAILGMTKREIDKKFDQIVDFSGVEKFIDTPTKHYSSGMKMRLAFAVAAHLEPEILIIDEVLAVGDAEFQRKCLGKMDEVAKAGRTVLFVSHNLVAVESLCTRALYLQAGRLCADGATHEIIPRYYAATTHSSPISRRGSSSVLSSFRILDQDGNVSAQLSLGGSTIFEIEGNTHAPRRDATINIRIDGMMGERVAACHTHYQHREPLILGGQFRIRCRLHNCRIMPGSYYITVIMKSDGETLDQCGPIPVEVAAKDVYGTGRVLPAHTGSYVPEASWELLPVSETA